VVEHFIGNEEVMSSSLIEGFGLKHTAGKALRNKSFLNSRFFVSIYLK
jgi:hypothetical protein